MRRFALAAAAALIAGGCGGTAPTPIPPPPTEDPPKITCPAPQTVQLTAGSSATVTYTPTTSNGRAPVTVVCTPPSGSAFGIGQATVNCVATDALQRTDPCSFPITVLAPPPAPTLIVTTFLAFGDSITWGEDGRNSVTSVPATLLPRVRLPLDQTYPGVLLQLLAARYTTQTPRVDNRGQPGEAISDPPTADVPTTAVSRFDALLPGHGAVLIMEGTNDLPKAHSAANQAAADNILATAAAGLRQMVRDAKASGSRAFLATIPPMNPAGSRGQTFGWELVAGFNDRVASVAANEQVPLVDVNKAFGGNLGLLGSDGVHPTAEGYQKIADSFFAAIKGTLETRTSSTASAPAIRRR